MKPITDPTLVNRYTRLVDEMLVLKGTYERDFDPAWLRRHGWKVVPAKSEISHFSPEEIERNVPALTSTGFKDCVAVATEVLDPLPACYRLAISKEDFYDFNRECGLLGYLLMDEDRSWSMSCYATYKLLAGPTKTVEALLGKPIAVAREEFLAFARSLDKGLPNTPFSKMASRYTDT